MVGHVRRANKCEARGNTTVPFTRIHDYRIHYTTKGAVVRQAWNSNRISIFGSRRTEREILAPIRKELSNEWKLRSLSQQTLARPIRRIPWLGGRQPADRRQRAQRYSEIRSPVRSGKP